MIKKSCAIADYAPSLSALHGAQRLLGLVVAIAVTIFIWPYRITQHLNQNRKKRFQLIHQQFIGLLNACKNQKLPLTWKSAQQKLVTTNRSEQKYINAALGSLREKNQAELDLEMDLIRYITRLGETLPKLPDNFWKFTNLKDSMISLMETLTKELERLPKNKHTDNLTAVIAEKTTTLLDTFTKFRLFYRKAENYPYTIEQIYQIFTSIQLIQQCSEIIAKLQKTLSFS